MRAFTPGELTGLQATQEGAMQDTCQLLRRSSSTVDDFNRPVEVWTVVAAYVCGYEPLQREEGMEETEVGQLDARLRLPLAVESELDSDDRLKITKRFGVTLSAPPTLDIVGLARRGPSGLVLDLRLVTDGSDS